MHEERRYAIAVAWFAAGLYLALLVAAFGLTSLATNTEVVADPSAGPLVGPTMMGAAVVVLLSLLIVAGARVQGDRQRIAPLTALGTGMVCFLAYCLAGGVAGVFVTGDGLHFAFFAVGQLGSAYAIIAGAGAVVVAVLYQLVLAGRFRQRGRPRWPWEHDDDA